MRFTQASGRRVPVRTVDDTVARPVKSAAKPDRPFRVYAFDLDGTLLLCNSTRTWGWHLLRANAPRGGVVQRTRVLALKAMICAVGALRTSSIISHGAAKRSLQLLASQLAVGASADDLQAHEQAIVRELMTHVSPELTRIIARIRARNEPIILTTATVAECAEPLGAALGFNCICATPRRGNGQWFHNIGARKAKATVEAAESLGAGGAPLVVFVDQLDDLPLILCAETVCWFGCDDDLPLLETFLHPGVSIIQARDVTADALAEALGLAVPEPPERAQSDAPIVNVQSGGGAAVLRSPGE